MKTAINTYHPSGRISWRFPVFVLLAGLPAIVVLAIFYATAFLMTPPVLLAPIVSLIFAAFCGVTVAFVAGKGHSRSVVASTAMAVLLCLVFIWVHWVVIFGALGEAERFAFSNPLVEARMLWEFAVTNHANNPRVLSPVARCIVWVLEVGLFMCLMVFLARAETRIPYSEAARCWAKKEVMGELFPEKWNVETLQKELAVQRIAPLLDMNRADKMQVISAALEWSTLKLTGYKIEKNSQEHWIDIEWIVHRRTSEGKIKSHSNKDLVKTWILTHEEYAALLNHFNTEHDDMLLERSGMKFDTESGTESSSSETNERPTPQELAPAVEALEAGNFAEAVAKAEPYREHPEEHIRMDALRLCALGKSRQERWAEAYADFDKLFGLEPSVHNALQLALTSVMAGELSRGEICFGRADGLNLERNEMPSAGLRTTFLSALGQAGELAAGKPHVDWLAAGYRALSITDDTFLFMRGFPFFSVFLEKSLPVLRASVSEEEIPAWYENLRQGVDEEGKAVVDAFLKASVYN